MSKKEHLSYDYLKLLVECASLVRAELRLPPSERCSAISVRFGEHIIEWLDGAIKAADSEADEQSRKAYDESSALTPQWALRALADGKCVGSGKRVYKLSDLGAILSWVRHTEHDYEWVMAREPFLSGLHVVADPSTGHQLEK